MTGELVSPKTERLYVPNISCCSPPDQKCMALVVLTLGSSALADPLIFYSLAPDHLHLETASSFAHSLCSFLCAPESSLFMTQEQQLPPILCAFPPHC